MATTHDNAKYRRMTGVLQELGKDVKPLQAFWMKFNNDWSWNNSAGLAYNLLLSIFPLVLACVAILGLFLGGLAPTAYDHVIQQIENLLPASTSYQSIIRPALNQIKHDSGLLGVLAIGLALFNGSRLFLFMEGCLDIIYHVRPRGIIGQNVMAVGMLLLFVVLIPIIVLASSLPAVFLALLQRTPLSQLPGSGLIFGLGGILGGFIAGYILFQAIYMVVPNQKISFRRSWLGAVVAAILLEAYLALFPLYVTHFLGSFAGALGILILLVFFYYFAMILFLGAEVNAFFAEGIYNTPQDLATMVHLVTSHLPTSKEAMQEEAAADHKDEEPKVILPEGEYNPSCQEDRHGDQTVHTEETQKPSSSR